MGTCLLELSGAAGLAGAAAACFAGADLIVFGVAAFAAEALTGAAFFAAAGAFVVFLLAAGVAAAFRPVDFGVTTGLRAFDFAAFFAAGLAAVVALRDAAALFVAAGFLAAVVFPAALAAGFFSAAGFFAAGLAVVAGFRGVAAGLVAADLATP